MRHALNIIFEHSNVPAIANIALADLTDLSLALEAAQTAAHPWLG